MHELREPVHFGAVGKESDEITPVVDAVDDRTRDAKCGCLRRTRVIKLKICSEGEEETVYAAAIGESTDDLTIVVAAKRCRAGGSHAVDFDIERIERLTETPKETVIVAALIRPKAADLVVVSDVAGLGRNRAGKS